MNRKTNESKWRSFLSSIKGYRVPSNNLNLTTKTSVECLASEFANKLLLKKGGTVEISGNTDLLAQYMHLDVRKSSSSKSHVSRDGTVSGAADDSICRKMLLEEHDTVIIKSVDETSVSERSSKNDNYILASKIDRNDPFDYSGDDSLYRKKPLEEQDTVIIKSVDETCVSERSSKSDDYIVSKLDRNVAFDDSDDDSQYRKMQLEEQDAVIIEGSTSDQSLKSANSFANTTTFTSPIKNGNFKRSVECEGSINNETFIPAKAPRREEFGFSLKEITQTADRTQSYEKFQSISDGEREPMLSEEESSQMKVKAKSTKNTDEKANLVEENYPKNKNYISFKSETEKSCQSTIEVSVDSMWQLQDDVHINRIRERDKHPKSRKSDIDKPCSKWTVSNIAEYFVFDDCVKKMEIPTECFSSVEEIYGKVRKRIRELKKINGITLPSRKSNSDSDLISHIKSISSTEPGSRLIVDGFLIPVCVHLGCQIEMDKNINCNFLPNCRFDYCIKKDNIIIGCVEAKSIKSLNANSLVQGILELMILQTTLLDPGKVSRDLRHFPVFAIITDGHRFIYIQLDGSTLRFEHEGGKIRVHEITEEGDFRRVLRHICFLVNGGNPDSESMPIETNVLENDESDVIVID